MNARVKLTVISTMGDLRQGDLFSVDFGDTWHVFNRWENGRAKIHGEKTALTIETTPDTPCAVRIYDRTDEALFRISVPRVVGGLVILEVTAFRPGSRPGYYASALAVAVNEEGAYSTHRVICTDDFTDGDLHWFIEHGHYDYATRAEADADIVERRRS